MTQEPPDEPYNHTYRDCDMTHPNRHCAVCGAPPHPSAPEDTGTEREGNITLSTAPPDSDLLAELGSLPVKFGYPTRTTHAPLSPLSLLEALTNLESRSPAPLRHVTLAHAPDLTSRAQTILGTPETTAQAAREGCTITPKPSADLPEGAWYVIAFDTPDRTPRQSLEPNRDQQPVTLTQAQLTEGIRLLEADCPPRYFCLIHHTNDLSLCSGRCVVVTFGTQKEYRTIPCQQPVTTHHGQHFDLMDPKCAGYFTCLITRGLKHASACPLSEEP